MESAERKGGKCLTVSVDCVETLLSAVDFPLKAKEILVRNVDFSSYDIKEVEIVLEELRDFFKEHIKHLLEDEKKEKNYKVLKAYISLMKLLVEEKTFVNTSVFATSIAVLSFLLTTNSFDVWTQNQAAHVCVRFYEGLDRYGDTFDAATCTLCYLLELTLGKIAGRVPAKVDFKRVWDMKGLFKTCLLTPSTGNVKSLLLQCVTSPSYLDCRDGRMSIAAILSSDLTLVSTVHDIIRKQLPERTKTMANWYGDVYFNAWNMANPDVQKLIEEKCIQDLMEVAFKSKRYGLNMARPEANVFEILSSLHSFRRSPKFSNTITELYAPLIWRYLKSYEPLERCNAAQIFLDVFPFEKRSKGIVVNSQFKERQMKEIYDLLMDDCHFVRIIATQGVCRHLTHSQECFTVSDVRHLMKIILTLACDGSSFNVRSAVFEGFEYMMGQEESALLVLKFLPNMALHIHDVHEKVRVAFIKLLIKVQENSEKLGKNYWDFVPVKHLIARLLKDNRTVGGWIAKLLIPEIYVSGSSVERSMKRFVKLIDLNRSALKTLFSFVDNILTIDDIYLIIVTIIGILANEIRIRLRGESEVENQGPSAQSRSNRSSTIPRKRAKLALNDLSNTSKNDRTEGRREWLDDSLTVAELISTAAMLYAKFLVKSDEYVTYSKKIQELSVSFVQPALLLYKGTLVYYTVINYASLIPLSALNPVSTVGGACLSELKEMREETSSDITRCLIYSLCTWKRGHQVLELATEWLNYAFQSQNLSESILPLRTTRRTTRVRFTPEIGKPSLAIKLLDCLLGDVWNERHLLRHSYNNVYEFYLFLDRIKVLLEKRINNGGPFNELLSDDVLLGCYRKYLLLAITLHRPDQPPDASSSLCCVNVEQEHVPIVAFAEFIQHLPWVTNILVHNLPSRDDNDENHEVNPPFVVKCLLEVLKTGYYLSGLSLTSCLLAQTLSLFVISILGTDCNVYFLETSIMIASALADQGELHTQKDEWNLFNRILPSFVSKILEVITLVDLTAEDLKSHVKDFEAMKKSLFHCLLVTKRFYGETHMNFRQMYNLYVYACIEIVANVIKTEDNFTFPEKLVELPKMAAETLKHLISKEPVYQYLLTSLNQHITMNKEEGVHLLSCLSILYALSHYGVSKFVKSDVEDCIHNGFSCLQHFNKEKIDVMRKDDTTFMYDTGTIDIYGQGVMLIDKLCEYVGCSPQLFQ